MRAVAAYFRSVGGASRYDKARIDRIKDEEPSQERHGREGGRKVDKCTVTFDFRLDAKEAVPVPYSWSISMFCFVPLLAMETIIPTPARITTPITIQVVSMFCRMPSFQSAARTPPMSKINPRKYIPAHFMAHLLIGERL
jgi:hypothetical protein